MRHQQLKLTKGHSTKAERIFSEILKSSRIPFRTKVMAAGREIDFLIGNLAIEIDGHDQDTTKNSILCSLGYVPLHYGNRDIREHRDEIKKEILKLWQEQETRSSTA